jgi:nucleotide-binding universal stress UspA family protein
MKNILVPTDFSECAQNATIVALQIASQVKASIHFLHIMPSPDESVHVPNITKLKGNNVQKGHAQDKLNALVAAASKVGVMATPLLVLDKGNEQIETYIKPLDIDFVVMGSHGATGIRELVIGSNTQRVVRHATVPVLVIKNLPTKSLSVKGIVFATTLQDNVLDAFDSVAALAKLWKAKVHILVINFMENPGDQALINKVVKELTQPYPDLSTTQSSIEVNDEEWGIHQFLEKTDAEMIAITKYDKTGFILSHSVAEDLVNHEDVPVLVIGSHNDD